MITQTLSNTTPATLNGMRVEAFGQVSAPFRFIEEPDRALDECCNILKVFGGGTNDLQNDFTSFVFKQTLTTDTFAFQLQRWDGSVWTTDVWDITDDSYGFLYAPGTWSSPYNKYTGLILKWGSNDGDNVYTRHGAGSYRLAITVTGVGAGTYYSYTYELMEYSVERAKGTCRFEWYQTGNILSGVDYSFSNSVISGNTSVIPLIDTDVTGPTWDNTAGAVIGWPQQIRIPGKIVMVTPELTEDTYYLNSTRKSNQIRTWKKNNYECRTGMLTRCATDELLDNMIFANNIYMTDYNVYNHYYIENYNVKFDAFSEFKNFDRTRNARLTLKFTDKTQNKLKTNCA